MLAGARWLDVNLDVSAPTEPVGELSGARAISNGYALCARWLTLGGGIVPADRTWSVRVWLPSLKRCMRRAVPWTLTSWPRLGWFLRVL